ETTPLQGRLAITVSRERDDLIEALRAIDVRHQSGLVALVGCPADASLLGAWARSLIDAADLILHDRLIPAGVKDLLGDRGEYVGKKGHAHSTTQAHIHRRILHESEKGKMVLRLHGGEPGILGHLGETLDFCQAWGLRTEVVPAVSAAQVAAARAQCSLTHREDGRSITFLSGHRGLEDHDPAALSPAQGHLAVYMGVRDLDAIRQRLLKAGWPEDSPVTAGIHLGDPEEAVVHGTLKEISNPQLSSPAVLLVGPRSHASCTTLFTGTDPSKFLRHGPLLHFPLIELRPRPLEERVQLIREGLARWDGIIFPSSPAVRFFMEALLVCGDSRRLAGKQLLAVGPHTARTLASFGLRADAVPEGFGGAAALAELPGLQPGLYAYLRSSVSPVQERQDALASAGIRLDPGILYENLPVKHRSLPARPFQRVLFTAASTVRVYFDSFPEEREAEREWLAVGSSTLRALQERGLRGSIIS
ncbi:MAG: SAM-dependent methyltransferase, partial [Kiritimatiellia bacterium]